jgi:hypothetical protein
MVKKKAELTKEEIDVFSAKPCEEPDRSKLEATKKKVRSVVVEECPRCHRENEVPYFFCECGARRIASYG